MPVTTYNAGFDDDESVNNSSRSNFLYKDLNLFFTKNPVSGDISIVSDIQNIKRSVRNIVLLNTWDKPFHPEIGTNIRAALFENFTPPVIVDLRNKITRAISRWEPRVSVENVSFNDPNFQRMDNNTLGVKIEFVVRNASTRLEEVEVLLKRVR
jgi:hypothetical protein